MCGILASKDRDFVGAKLYEQQNRGTQGAGFLLVNQVEQGKDKFYSYKDSNIFSVFGEMYKVFDEQKAKFVMFHHRYPTSTGNTPETAHPFTNPNDQNYYGIHNGVISNASEVLGELAKTSWFTGNDSQAIIYEISEAIRLDLKTYELKSTGNAAVVIANVESGRMWFYRNTNPLHLAYTLNGNWLLSSEPFKKKLDFTESMPTDGIYEVIMDSEGNFDKIEKCCDITLPPRPVYVAPKKALVVNSYPTKSYYTPPDKSSYDDYDDYDVGYYGYTGQKKKKTPIGFDTQPIVPANPKQSNQHPYAASNPRTGWVYTESDKQDYTV